MNTKNSLVALELFSKLYDQGKNIYDIVEVFVLNVLNEKHFSDEKIKPTEIVENIRVLFGFLLPVSVVKTACKNLAIKKILIKEGDGFLSTGALVLSEENVIDKTTEEYAQFFLDITRYIEKESKTTLSDDDSKRLLEDLYYYLINSFYEGKYVTHIKSFIVSKENTYNKLLEDLSKGSALYNGLQFTTGNNDFSSRWNTPFKIFLSTEIIFDLWELNGVLYKRYMDDLIELVSDANSSRKNIVLVYSDETNKAIENFFQAAAKIIQNKSISHSVAMREVVNSCDSPSDAFKLLAGYKSDLLKKGITLHKSQYNSNDESLFPYNIDSEELRQEFVEDGSDSPENEKIGRFIYDFNEINIIRKNFKFSSIESSKAISLSRDSLAFRIAKYIAKDDDKTVPLLSTYDILINVIWFKTSSFKKDKKHPITLSVLRRSELSLETIFEEKMEDVKQNAFEIVKSESYSEQDKQHAIDTIEMIKKNNHHYLNSDAEEKSIIYDDNVEKTYNKLCKKSQSESKLKDEKISYLEDENKKLNEFKNAKISKDIDHLLKNNEAIQKEIDNLKKKGSYNDKYLLKTSTKIIYSAILGVVILFLLNFLIPYLETKSIGNLNLAIDNRLFAQLLGIPIIYPFISNLLNWLHMKNLKEADLIKTQIKDKEADIKANKDKIFDLKSKLAKPIVK